MKKITLVLILLISSSSLFAQLGVGTVTPDSTSMLDISTTDKGLLIPRLTQTQRNAINNPAHSLLVFCVDCSPIGMYYYDTTNTNWTVVDTDTQLNESTVDAFVANNGYLTSFTEVDGSITNEIQTISRSGTMVTLSNNGGSFTDSVLTETQVDAMVSDNGYLTSFTEVDGSTTNEIQNIDLTNNTLSIDNANSVDLSSYLDNTDDQQISKTGNTVTLEDGGSFTDSVLTETQVDAMVSNNGYILEETVQDLTKSGLTISLSGGGGSVTDSVLTETQVDAMVSDNGYLTSFTEVDGSTTNEIQDLDLNNNTLSIENGNSVDLSSYLDNTDNQQISKLGTTVTLEDGGSFTDSVLTETQVDAMVSDNGYLTSFTEVDGSTTNEIQNIDLTNNTLSIDNANSVDLSSYLDNTDNQQISKSGSTVTLEDGGSFTDSVLTETQVDAMVSDNGYLTSFTEVDGSITNEIQTISRSGTTVTLSNNGGSFADSVLTETQVDAMVSDNGYLTSFTEVDGSTTNEIQNIDLTNNTLSIDNANSVDLSSYLDNTDNQQISKTGTTVTLENGGSFTDSVLTETQVDEMVADNNYAVGQILDTANGVIIPGGAVNQATDDFVFGSDALDATGKSSDHESRMIFDKSQGFFAAGSSTTQWEESKRGLNSASFGENNEVSGNESFAAGQDNVVAGSGSAAFGDDHVITSSGVYSFAAGDDNTIDAPYSNAFGWNNSINSNSFYSTVFGHFNTNNNIFSFNAGQFNTVDGAWATAMGQNLTSKSKSEFVIGYYNENYTAVSTSGNDDADRLFVIGNGTSSSRSNAVTVLKGGEMGIGTSTPTHTLDVSGEGRFTDSLTIGAYTLPPSDGSDNQVFTTDGNGNVSWANDNVLTETQVDAMVANNGYLTSFTDNQDLSLSGNNLSIENGNSVDLSSYLDNTDDQTLSFSNNSLSIENGNSVNLSSLEDNLGDHTATQNIELDGNWLSNDGGNEGMKIDDNGNIGINTESPLAPLHISGTETINGIPHVQALFGAATGGYTDGKIEVRSIRGSVTSSEGGVVLTNYDTNIDSTNVMGDMSILGVDNADNLGGIRFRTTADGTYANMTNALEIDKDQNINIPNGNLTVGDYTLPTTDGTANQVLSTDGNGDVSWITDADGSMTNEIQDLSLSGNTLSISSDPNTDVDLSSYLDNTDDQSISRDGLTVTLENGGSFTDSVDNMGNHIATENIQLNGNWISNDGGDEGISIQNNGRVGVGTDSAHTAFHVGSSNNLNDVPSVYALFGQTEGSGILDGKIELRSNRTGVSNGEGGVVLTNFDNDISATKVMGDLAMMGEDNTNNLGGIRLRTSADGTYANMTNALEIDKNQNINIPNGALTVGEYTLPTTDGIENQVLATDGEGNLSWEAAASMSNITLKYNFNPSTQANIYENYLGTFNCTDGKISLELIDAGNSHGASNYYDITVDFGSTPVVTFHHDAVAGNGYLIYYRQISGCSYELFFESQNTWANVNINYTANIRASGVVDTTLSASNDTDILPCNTGVTVDRLGRVGISNTNPTEELDVTGDAAISGTLKVGAYTLPSTDGTADQILKTNGSGALSWIDNDLFNHTATQNIALNDNWISNGGGSNGIKIQPSNGYVGINTDSALVPLHVQGAATSSGVSHIQATFGSTQGSGIDGKIEVRSVRGSVTSSTGGVVLTNYDLHLDASNVMGDMSILGTDNTNNLGGIRFRTTADGTYANMTSALEIDKDQNINIPNGNLTLGAITLPSTDGTANQILKTDGSGNVSWTSSDDIVTSVFDTANGAVVPGSALNYATQDFVFGSDELDAAGKSNDHKNRIIFDKSKGFFAAGISANHWTDSLRGDYSTAFGNNNKAIGTGTFVAGSNNTVRGDGSTSFGGNNTVLGTYSLNVGNANYISADYGLTVGQANFIVGEYSNSYGFLNQVYADYAFNVGKDNIINADFSTVFGSGLESESPSEFIVGYYNESYTPTNSTGNNDNDRLFIIGNGTSGSRSNAVTVLKGGEFGIGTSSPAHALDVSGDGRFTGNLLVDAGNIGIGTSNPLAGLHVTTNVDGLNGIPHVTALFGDEETGLHSTNVEIKGSSSNNTFSETGLVLSNYDEGLGSTNIMGQLGVLGEDGVNNLGGLRLRTTSDGTYAGLANALEVDKNQNVNIPNGSLTIGNFELPTTDGSSNQVLKTDGNGNVSWADDADTPADNLGNHQLTTHLATNNKWINNSGVQGKGIFVGPNDDVVTVRDLLTAERVNTDGLTIGDGDRVVLLQKGQVSVSTTGNTEASVSVTFRRTYSSEPIVTVGLYNTGNSTNIYNVTITSVSTTGATFRVRRIDGNSIGDALTINWLAME